MWISKYTISYINTIITNVWLQRWPDKMRFKAQQTEKPYSCIIHKFETGYKALVVYSYQILSSPRWEVGELREMKID